MRHTILKDKKITLPDLLKWKEEDVAFWEKHLEITPTYQIIEVDYTDYPTYLDSDNDIRPTNKYLQELNNLATKKVGDSGTDFVVVLIHEDNWKSAGPLWEEYKKQHNITKEKGIWGTNYSYIFGKQCLEYCRWDKDNLANSFGTIYHERHHSLDAVIKIELGIDVNSLLGTTRYDHEITHGNNPKWKYIRHKENLESLRIMKPLLQKAFKKRVEENEKINLGLMEKVISLATQYLYLLRINKNKKDGMSKI